MNIYIKVSYVYIYKGIICIYIKVSYIYIYITDTLIYMTYIYDS